MWPFKQYLCSCICLVMHNRNFFHSNTMLFRVSVQTNSVFFLAQAEKKIKKLIFQFAIWATFFPTNFQTNYLFYILGMSEFTMHTQIHSTNYHQLIFMLSVICCRSCWWWDVAGGDPLLHRVYCRPYCCDRGVCLLLPKTLHRWDWLRLWWSWQTVFPSGTEGG